MRMSFNIKIAYNKLKESHVKHSTEKMKEKK